MGFEGLKTCGSICVLGLGITGQALCRLFTQYPPEQLTVYTGGVAWDALSVPEGTRIIENPEDLCGPFALTVASPGIPQTSALYRQAQELSGELLSEPEFAWRLSPEHWIVVTGTNGKTTTTALCAHVLQKAGIPARVAGNIGIPCVDAVQQRTVGEYIVAELSSFQLASAPRLAPEAAIILAIGSDHLAWHGGQEAYVKAKTAFVEHMDAAAPLVVDATLPTARAFYQAWKSEGRRALPLGSGGGLREGMVERCGAPEAAWLDAASGQLTVALGGRTTRLLAADELQIIGDHNSNNALAVATLACALGALSDQVSAGLASFGPLEHRIEPVATLGGVQYVNDSKATNPEATTTALKAFVRRPVCALLGGRDKLTPLDELVSAARSSCRALVCYGEAGPRFYEALVAGGCADKTSCVASFEEAFVLVADKAVAGDVVLLSPACSSYDEFTDYEQRGARFKELVAQLAAQMTEGRPCGQSAANVSEGIREEACDGC